MTFFSLSTSKTSSTTPIQQYSLFNLTLLPSPLQISWPLQVNVKRWQFGYTGKCHKGTGSLSTRELRKLHVFCLLYKNPLPLAILPDHLILNCKYLTSKKSAPCSWHLVVRLCIDDTSFYEGGGGSHFGLKRPPEVCVGIRATFENANIGTASVAFGEGQGHLHPYITTSRPWLYYYCSVSFAKHIIIFNSSYLIISLSTWLVVGSQSSLKQHLNSYPRVPDRDNENPVCWKLKRA